MAAALARVALLWVTAGASAPGAQRVLILAGPHKTASTAIQGFTGKLRRFGLLGDYVFPNAGFKGFSALVKDIIMSSINASELPDQQFRPVLVAHATKRGKNEPATVGGAVTQWKDKFSSLWGEGSSIVMATELAGTSALHSSFSDAVHVGYAKLFSFTDRSHVTIALTHRAPRLEHLGSVWHQQVKMLRMGKEGIPFKQWMCEMSCELPLMSLDLKTVDTLGMAAAFHEYGFPVVVVSMQGVLSAGLDVCHMVACEVLGTPCEGGWVSHAKFPRQPPHGPKNSSELQGVLHVSPAQAEALEEVLLELDCANAQRLRDAANVRFVYGDFIGVGCSAEAAAAARPREHACKRIQDILQC